MAGAPESLHSRLENRKIYAIEIVCCGRWLNKSKNVPKSGSTGERRNKAKGQEAWRTSDRKRILASAGGCLKRTIR
jgi:hypothetical protein